MIPERKMTTVSAAGSSREDKVTQVNFGSVASEEAEIDLLDLAYALLDRLQYIILCFLAGALLMNAYAFFLIEPTYQSTAKLYVVSASSDSVVNLSDLNMGTSLTADYEELILSYPVLTQVIEELDLDMTTDDLNRKITLTNPDNTRILRITVTDTDPIRARDIANTVADVSAEYLPETMDTIAPNVAQRAQVATQKAGPSYLKYSVIGALLGVLLCCGIIIVQYMMDDTIHSADDLEKYFGLVPLTTIPDSDLFRKEDEAEKLRNKAERRSQKRSKTQKSQSNNSGKRIHRA